MEIFHKPVFLRESVEYLNIDAGKIVVDCTVGEGGHSEEILRKIGPGGFLIGIDLDAKALDKSSVRLKEIGSNFILIEGNFRDILVIVKPIISKVDAVLADLGLSSLQLMDGERGFSFMKEGPLDMRMCPLCTRFSAYDVVNSFKESEISEILFYYGEEPLSRKIAKRIIEIRTKTPIRTTIQLAEIVQSIFPRRYYKTNPATRTFQALRIFVNDELENLKRFLAQVPEILNFGGRVAIISYHSLEDRLVKNAFKNDEELNRVNKKVIVPSYEEVQSNRRARSAKLRVAERI